MNQITRLLVYLIIGASAALATQVLSESRQIQASETQTITTNDAREPNQN